MDSLRERFQILFISDTSIAFLLFTLLLIVFGAVFYNILKYKSSEKLSAQNNESSKIRIIGAEHDTVVYTSLQPGEEKKVQRLY